MQVLHLLLLIQKFNGTRNGPSAPATWSLVKSLKDRGKGAEQGIKTCQNKAFPCRISKREHCLGCVWVPMRTSAVSEIGGLIHTKSQTIPIRNWCFPMAIARRQRLPQLDSLELAGVFLHTSTVYEQILKFHHHCLLYGIVGKGRGFLKDNWQWWNFLTVLVSDVCLLFEADCLGARPSCSHSTGRKRAYQPAMVADLYFADTLDYSHALYHWFFLY